VGGAAPPPPAAKEETTHRVRAGGVRAPILRGGFDCTDKKKDLYSLNPVVYHDVGKKKMIIVHLNRLASYQGAARDERPKGGSSGNNWKVSIVQTKTWGGR
jgi:hypothetical protein